MEIRTLLKLLCCACVGYENASGRYRGVLKWRFALSATFLYNSWPQINKQDSLQFVTLLCVNKCEYVSERWFLKYPVRNPLTVWFRGGQYYEL